MLDPGVVAHLGVGQDALPYRTAGPYGPVQTGQGVTVSVGVGFHGRHRRFGVGVGRIGGCWDRVGRRVHGSVGSVASRRRGVEEGVALAGFGDEPADGAGDGAVSGQGGGLFDGMADLLVAVGAKSVGQAVNVGEPDQVGPLGQADQGADQFEQPDLGSGLGLALGPVRPASARLDVRDVGARCRGRRGLDVRREGGVYLEFFEDLCLPPFGR